MANSNPAAESRRFPKQLTDFQHQRHVDELILLARRFDSIQAGLHSDTPLATTVTSLRSLASRAGRQLLVLLLHGVVAPPNSPPPWLTWSLPGRRRPLFVGSRHRIYSNWQPPSGVTGLVRTLSYTSAGAGDENPTVARQHDTVLARHRLVFLEAAAGWLGRRCQPRAVLRLCEAEVATVGGEQFVVSTDALPSKASDRVGYLLELAACGASCCRQLAAEVEARRQELVAASQSTASQNEHDSDGVLASARTTLDESVERTFDILGQYKESLLRPMLSLPSSEMHYVLVGMEGALEAQLPRAVRSGNDLLVWLRDHIDDRTAVTKRLQRTDLVSERVACVRTVACTAIRHACDTMTATVHCWRREWAHWRALLPLVRKRPDGQRYVDRAEQTAAWAPAMYWSTPSGRRPSRLGASLFLAEACECVAGAAHRAGLPRDAFLPAVRLAKRLQNSPDWAAVDPDEALRIIDTQMNLGLQVMDLLGELELVSSSVRGEESAADPTPTSIPLPSKSPQLEQPRPHDVTLDRGGMLIGWSNILPCLGLDPKNRRWRDTLKDLNTSKDGPIKPVGRKVIVGRSDLVAWWKRVMAEAPSADRNATTYRNSVIVTRDMANPGVQREKGFQTKGTPNKRRRQDM